MQSNLNRFLGLGVSSISNSLRRNPGLVKKVVLALVALGTLYAVVTYVNNYLYKSRAGTDDVSITMTPSKANVTPGEEFSISVPFTAEAGKKVSGADLKVKFDSDSSDKVEYIGYTLVPAAEYFNDEIVENVSVVDGAKLLQLTLVANKSDSQLSNSIIVALKFKAKENTSGTVNFVVSGGTQVVGTATDNQFTLPSTTIATSVNIGSENSGSGTPPPTPPRCEQDSQCPTGYMCDNGNCVEDTTIIPTPPSGGVLLSFSKMRIQGIIRKPSKELSRMPVKVTLKGPKGTFPMSVTSNFTADTNAEWSGYAVFPKVPAGNYSVFVKGRKHLQKKVCFAVRLIPTATTIPTPPYGEDFPEVEEEFVDIDCPNDKIALTPGDGYAIQSDPSVRVHMYAGDLPVDGVQDGLIDSLDLIYLRNRLGQKNGDYLKTGDLNLDQVIDTQDHSLPFAVLNLEINEDDE